MLTFRKPVCNWLAFMMRISLEPLLAVVWRQRMMGWFPTWEMGLDIAPSLVLPGRRGTGFVHTGIVITGPAEEHVYETTISYDPVSGLVSAAVVDLTAGSRIFAASARLKTHSGTLQALGGREYPERSESCFTFSPPQVLEAFVPVGAEWNLSLSDGPTLSERAQSMLSIDRRQHKELVSQLLHPQYDGAGYFRLIVDDGSASRELTRHPSAKGTMQTSIPTLALPVGRSRLALQYVHEERVWHLGFRSLRVGALRIAMAPVEISGDQWIGKLTLSGDGPFPDLNLKLDVTVSPCLTTPFESQKEILKATILDTKIHLDEKKPVTLSLRCLIPSRIIANGNWPLNPCFQRRGLRFHRKRGRTIANRTRTLHTPEDRSRNRRGSVPFCDCRQRRRANVVPRQHFFGPLW